MENLSLFNWESAEQEQMPQNNSGNLDVVKMEFLEAETLSWKELFSGFDTLYAVTYSSSIGLFRISALTTKAGALLGWWWKKRTASSPRVATPTKRRNGTSWPIPSSGLKICRCSAIPRP